MGWNCNGSWGYTQTSHYWRWELINTRKGYHRMLWATQPWKLKGLDIHMALPAYLPSHKPGWAEWVETLSPLLTLENSLNLVGVEAVVIPSSLSRCEHSDKAFGGMVTFTQYGSSYKTAVEYGHSYRSSKRIHVEEKIMWSCVLVNS